MKKPNIHLQKKYVSSLVIAAFLILSVLTAYNINMDRSPKAGTEIAKESSDQSDEVMGPAAKTTEEKEDKTDNHKEEDRELSEEDSKDADDKEPSEEDSKDADDKEPSEEDGKDADDKEPSEEDGKDADDEETSEEDSEDTAQEFSYDGKTKLTWPVVGNILLPYSMDTTVYYTTLDQYACNDGILIGAKVGDDVVCAADGRVVNLSKSDRYGTTMTILIGNYYEMYYSQIEDVTVEIGDTVKKGEVIAAVAEPTRSFILEGPHLFFKMTCKGEAVNPTNYLES